MSEAATPPTLDGLSAERFGSGRAVSRIEDPALVRGLGRYTDDLMPEGAAFLHLLRSPHAHGRILSIDVQAARDMPGVLGIWTGADLQAADVQPLPPASGFKRPDGQPMQPPPRRALAVNVVRYVGEPMVAVVAATRAEAQAVANAVDCRIDSLPAVTAAAAAVAADAPLVWAEGAPGNVLAVQRHGDRSACEAAFERAAHRIALDIDNQRLAACPMEPRSVLAQPISSKAGNRLDVHLSCQMPTAVRNGLAATLPGQSPESVRVRVGDVGGGFGMKTGLYPEDVVVAFCALQLQCPVKWQAERAEDFLSAVHGRDLLSRAELALDANGRVLALRVRSWANVGAYPTGAGVAIGLLIGPWVATSVYDIPLIDFELQAVLSHTASIGAYRGAGRPEAIYTIERLMDTAARVLAIDPAELRRRNFIQPQQMPYRSAMNQVYDSGQFERILDQGLVLANWGDFRARRSASESRGRLRGRGMATFLEWTGGNALTEQVQVRITADGFIEMTSATMAMGQGIATSYAQLAVDVFGVPIERIRILQGDTDRANGFGSAGSRSLFTGGAALRVAAKQAVATARDLAGQALEAASADIEYESGRFTVVGTDLSIGLFELAAQQPAEVIEADGSATADAPTWPNACHLCEVEIEPDTGEVQVVAYASVNDIGFIVNPMIVRGQVEGGAVQGIGQALCERIAYDPASGQLLSASFMDYALPRVDGFLDFKTAFDTSVPCLTNGLGVKGVGELGTIGATPAVVNAVIDALAKRVGPAVDKLQMPLTAEVVWQALQGRVVGATLPS